jgi:perosamine synthetase
VSASAARADRPALALARCPRARATARAPRTALLGGTTTAADCLAAAAHLLHARRLVDGPELAQFERAFAAQVGVGYAIAFAAGRVGLFAILRALGVGAGDEVLLQVPTHVVVPNAVRYAGAQPVFVDCRRNSYDIDLRDAARRAGPRTRALILQHTFGIPADLAAAARFCREHRLALIEDCVHALGARYATRPVGSFGRAAFFSTEETKTISTTMGGVATTDDAELAHALRAIQRSCARPGAWLTARYVTKLVAYHLLTAPPIHRWTRSAYERLGQRQPLPGPTTAEEARGLRPDGYERRLGNAQAALGLRQLARLDGNLRHREAVVAVYEKVLSEANVALPRPPRHGGPAYVRYPVAVADRDAALRALSPHTVPGLWFTSLLEEALAPSQIGPPPGTCPNAEWCVRHLVNLPTHPRVSLPHARRIAQALAAVTPGREAAIGAG